MNPFNLNTTSVSLAVTPTVISTLLSHVRLPHNPPIAHFDPPLVQESLPPYKYLNRKALHEKPTVHLSYDEAFNLVRAFLQFASHHTVEELQAFTSGWVPHPQWVRVKEIPIPADKIDEAAALLQSELDEDGIRQVGGRQWWQWRKPDVPLKAEWIEMRSDYQERKRGSGSGDGDGGSTRARRVMLYVHGGAYFFASVDLHRYMLQRHARKLKARVFAPKYRLAPQFPFPCGLHDCIAAYLYLLTVQQPNEIVLAGDSAGGGMVLSMLCALRDQGIPLPAGAVLISPWVDLTHSFPSVSLDNPFDYIPPSGFHHKPSRSWPPPNEDDMAMMRDQAEKRKAGDRGAAGTTTLEAKQAEPFKLESANGHASGRRTAENPTAGADDTGAADLPQSTELPKEPHTAVELSVTIDGKQTVVKDQIQMYTTNKLLPHPLVSPVNQSTLGGLPPLLIMTGGGETLRDEQIYVAHKCANPTRYARPDEKMNDEDRRKLRRYKPTHVQLQVWDDLCHVAPTLSFTRPAKYMYRSVSQFGAWALARAQNAEIDILDDDEISVITSSGSDNEGREGAEGTAEDGRETAAQDCKEAPAHTAIGKAGDTLPPFKNHMVRQGVTRHGAVYDLAPASELPGCTMDPAEVGVAKETPVRRWLDTKKHWEQRYARARAKVHRKIIDDMVDGYIGNGDGEHPPPTALAGRRRASEEQERKGKKKKAKSMGLALWSLWGSKHDEATVERERQAEEQPVGEDAPRETQGETVPRGADASRQRPVSPRPSRPPLGVASLSADSRPRSRSRIRTVVDEHQTSQPRLGHDSGAGDGSSAAAAAAATAQGVSPSEIDLALNNLEKGSTGTKPTAASPGSTSTSANLLTPGYVRSMGATGKRPHIDGVALPFSISKDADTASMMTLHSTTSGSGAVRPMSSVKGKGKGVGAGSVAGSNVATPASIDEDAVDGFFGAKKGDVPAVEVSGPQQGPRGADIPTPSAMGGAGLKDEDVLQSGVIAREAEKMAAG